MIRRLHQLEGDVVESAHGDETTLGDESHFDHWLNLVVSLLPEQFGAFGLREEVESHLRERVRDLMLTGETESEAVHRAVEEFGDAATFARRLVDMTHTHRRRRRMQSMLTGLGVLAVAGTTWLVAGTAISNAPPPSVFSSAEAPALPESLSNTQISLQRPTTLGAIFEEMRESTDSRVVVRWNPLLNAGLDAETEITHIVGDLLLDDMLRELREVLDGFEGHRLDWRFSAGILEVATREFFDARERKLICYDIAGIVDNGVAGEADIESLLINFASPNDWEPNGGELARLQFVSGHLFVEAPPRIHKKVEWLLNELRIKDLVDQMTTDEDTISTLESGDVVAVEVWGLYAPAELARFERLVERDGRLRLPEPFGVVEARGRSFDAVEQDLRNALSGIVNDPMISIFSAVNPAESVATKLPQ